MSARRLALPFAWSVLAPSLALAQPRISVESEVRFAPVLTGETAAGSVGIDNTGDAPLTLTAIAIADPAMAGFTSQNLPALPLSIEAGHGISFTVLLPAATRAGEFEAAIAIAANDPIRPQTRVVLRATVIGLREVLGDRPADFGAVCLSSAVRRPSIAVPIRNPLDEWLSVYSVVLRGTDAERFSVDDPGRVEIPSGQTLDLVVSLRGLLPGPQRAQVLFSTRQLAPINIPVDAFGWDWPPPSPAQLDFGDVRVGSYSAPQTVSLTAPAGAPPARVRVLSVDGPFEVVGDRELAIEVDRPARFALRYRAGSVGTEEGLLTVAGPDRDCRAVKLVLRGQGVPDPGPGFVGDAAGCGCRVTPARPGRPRAIDVSLVLGALVLAAARLARAARPIRRGRPRSRVSGQGSPA